MSNQDPQATFQDRFLTACQVDDFAANSKAVSGYDVWATRCVRDGQHVDIDGPFFTEEEATISAQLLRGTFRGVRAYFSCHCAAWNPDPAREQLIRDQARVSRSMLAIRLGVQRTTNTEEQQ